MKLGSLRSEFPTVPWIILTGTVSEEVFNDVVDNLQLLKPLATFKKPAFRKNIYYDVIYKNTIPDPILHLKKWVKERLGAPDENAKRVSVSSMFVFQQEMLM